MVNAVYALSVTLGYIALIAFCSTISHIRQFGFWRWRRAVLCFRYGWCPECKSSPPLPLCYVCEGSYDYGATIDFNTRGSWVQTYLAHGKQ